MNTDPTMNKKQAMPAASALAAGETLTPEQVTELNRLATINVDSAAPLVQSTDIASGNLRQGASIQATLGAAHNPTWSLAVAIRYTDQFFIGMIAISAGHPLVITTTTVVEPGLLRVLLFEGVAQYNQWKLNPMRGDTLLGTPPQRVRDGGGIAPVAA